MTPQEETAAETEVRLREELLSAAMHDLRSPLGALAIFCELIQGEDENPLTESQQQNLKMINDAAVKLQAIIEDSSEALSVYKSSLRLKTADVNLRVLVERAVTHFQVPFDSRKVDITFAPEPMAGPLVKADEHRLEHILWRLIEEALGYAQPGDSVQISEGFDNGNVVLAIKVLSTADAAGKRHEARASLKGRLGSRKPGDSRYSIVLCERLMKLMGGELTIETAPWFECRIVLPSARP